MGLAMQMNAIKASMCHAPDLPKQAWLLRRSPDGTVRHTDKVMGAVSCSWPTPNSGVSRYLPSQL